MLFGLILLVCIGSIVFRGFNLGIDFTGGTRVQLPASSSSGTISVDAAKETFEKAIGKEPTAVQTVGTGDAATIQIRSETLTAEEVFKLKATINDDLKPNG